MALKDSPESVCWLQELECSEFQHFTLVSAARFKQLHAYRYLDGMLAPSTLSGCADYKLTFYLVFQCGMLLRCTDKQQPLPIFILICEGDGVVIPEWCRSRFCGFRSLWTTPLDCKVYMAEAADIKCSFVTSFLSNVIPVTRKHNKIVYWLNWLFQLRASTMRKTQTEDKVKLFQFLKI